MANPTSSHYSAPEWSAYADGELPTARRDAMRNHLHECPDCAAVLRSFHAVQRGAEQLAQQPPPARPQLRSRLISVGAVVVEQARRRQRWLVLLTGVVVVVVLAGLAWMVWRGMTAPSQPPQTVVATPAIRVSLDHVLVARYFVEPPSLEYDVIICNNSARVLEIIRVIVSDPLGEKERPVAAALRVEPGQTLHRVFSRPVAENARLRSGRYRILLETSEGRLVAEKLVP